LRSRRGLRLPPQIDERAIGDELFALGYDVGVTLGRWALLHYSLIVRFEPPLR
jgi:hypothetical protein